jgi:hypothetical protein
MFAVAVLVPCGCETWSVTVRKEHRTAVFEYRILWILETMRVEVTGGLMRLHDEVLHNL